MRSHAKPIRGHFGTWRAASLTSEAIDGENGGGKRAHAHEAHAAAGVHELRCLTAVALAAPKAEGCH